MDHVIILLLLLFVSGEYERVQKKAFTNWINSHLIKVRAGSRSKRSRPDLKAVQHPAESGYRVFSMRTRCGYHPFQLSWPHYSR